MTIHTIDDTEFKADLVELIPQMRAFARSLCRDPVDQTMAEETLVAVSNPSGRLELDELRRAMNMLPDDQREALVLIGAGGLSYEEAAEICGTAVGTIKSRVSRARVRVAELLEEGDLISDGIDPGAAMDAIFNQIPAMRARAA